MIGLPRRTDYRRPRDGDEQASEANADLPAAIAQMPPDFHGYGLRAGPQRANHKRMQRVSKAMLLPALASR